MQRVVFHEAELQLAEVEDLADLPDEQEIHTFDDGKFGSLTKKATAGNGASLFGRPYNFNETSTVFNCSAFKYLLLESSMKTEKPTHS